MPMMWQVGRSTLLIALLLSIALSVLAVPPSRFLGKDLVTRSLQSQRLGNVLRSAKDQVVFEEPRDESISDPSFPEYGIRISETEICDTAVKQYSGYFDVSDDKHLFFWFFESRVNPDEAPVILWLSGGPGCSFTTASMFEFGPCLATDEGRNVTFNLYSWNSNASIIFLGQPVNVGFSYADNGTTVDNSFAAAKDTYVFLQLFFGRFKKYSKLPLHLAGESYGGVYAPNVAMEVSRQNKALSKIGSSPASQYRSHINLVSIVIANGMTDPYTQIASSVRYVCGDGPFPVYGTNGIYCKSLLKDKVPICQRLIKSCYDSADSELVDKKCPTATRFCFEQIMDPLMEAFYNPYDVRRKCNHEQDGRLCYKELEWIEPWMNNPEHKQALGVDQDRIYSTCNGEVYRAFMRNGDVMHNTAALLPELVNEGVRLLVYSGDADLVCNHLGSQRWVEELETRFSDEYTKAKYLPWTTPKSGRRAGEVKSAGGDGKSAGNVTFVRVYEAGHLLGYDQPEAALDLITRWIQNIPLSDPTN